MPKTYLTIDDGPSERHDDLLSFLKERSIPALFFHRGDQMDKNMDLAIHTIENGFMIGNHSYAHIPAGDLSFEEWRNDFERAENLIEKAYALAGTTRPGKFYRFPYIDRGDGDRLERRYSEIIKQGRDADIPQNDPVQNIQAYLQDNGFYQPFDMAGHPLYQHPIISDARDCLLTYSSSDWMLADRHKGKQPCQTLDDLIGKAKADPLLWSDAYPHHLLCHDQGDIMDDVCGFIDYFYDQGFEFLDFTLSE